MSGRGITICDTWARIPGLSNYWCLQIQWRMDDNAIKALTESRFAVPDGNLDTIVLVQTIYLLQLFIHLQEFDPCLEEHVDEEQLRIFQDTIAENYSPAPPTTGLDGETLERVVRGLMLAHREGQREVLTGSEFLLNNSLQRLVLQLLTELNRPLYKNGRSRYEEAHGDRTNETWAARYATRIMQWRFTIRTVQWALREQIVMVGEDVSPLDAEGVEVYRVLRVTAPGDIHMVTPLQPDLLPEYNPQHQQMEAALRQHRSMGSPSRHTPVQTPRSSVVTPLTPQQQQQQQQPYPPQQGNSALTPSQNLKRNSPRLITLPPMKRQRQDQDLSTETISAEGNNDGKEEESKGAVPPLSGGDQQTIIPSIEQQHTTGDDSKTLKNILDKVTGINQRIEGMHLDLSKRFEVLEQRLGRIEEWITDPE